MHLKNQNRTLQCLNNEEVKELKGKAQKYLELSIPQHTSYQISETVISANYFNAHLPSNI